MIEDKENNNIEQLQLNRLRKRDFNIFKKEADKVYELFEGILEEDILENYEISRLRNHLMNSLLSFKNSNKEYVEHIDDKITKLIRTTRKKNDIDVMYGTIAFFIVAFIALLIWYLIIV